MDIRVFADIPDSPPALFPPVPDEKLDKEAKEALGYVSIMTQHLNRLPWLARASVLLESYAPQHIDLDLSSLTDMVVAQDHACRYCYGASRAFLKMIGYSENFIRKLEMDLHSSELPEKIRRGLILAKQLSRHNPRPQYDDLASLEKYGYSEVQIMELVFVATISCVSPRISTALALPPEPFEKFANGPIVKIMKPIFNFFSRKKKKVPIRTNFPENYDGPFSMIIEALRPVPQAATLIGEVLMAGWESPVLSKRAKALIVLVVSKAVGCGALEGDAVKILLTRGFTETEIAEIGAKLATGSMDPMEKNIILFARETVRFEPSYLQMKAREFSAGIAPEVFLEVLGISAIANFVSRLSVILRYC